MTFRGPFFFARRVNLLEDSKRGVTRRLLSSEYFSLVQVLWMLAFFQRSFPTGGNMSHAEDTKVVVWIGPLFATVRCVGQAHEEPLTTTLPLTCYEKEVEDSTMNPISQTYLSLLIFTVPWKQ